jgi:serine/threonine protein phosphatase PrpC
VKPTRASSPLLSAATATGGRPHQEDRFVQQRVSVPAVTLGWLLAVFDGHRGSATADTASSALLPEFESALGASHGNILQALKIVFLALNRLTLTHLPGSTASVVFIPDEAREVFWAVLGDSPVALMDSKGTMCFGPDHNVRTNPQERAAALARGGTYFEGYLGDPDLPDIGLQMARSLGDSDLSRVLNREPELEATTLGGNGIVLVGSDGLLAPWEGPREKQLTRLLHLIEKGADAEAIVQDALARNTGDNVTALVWKFFGRLSKNGERSDISDVKKGREEPVRKAEN